MIILMRDRNGSHIWCLLCTTYHATRDICAFGSRISICERCFEMLQATLKGEDTEGTND